MALRVTSVNKLAVLLALHKQPLHGYAIMDAVEHSLGSRPGPAQIYPFLAELEKKKFVKAARAVGLRDKTVYSLTAKGGAFVREFTGSMGTLLEGALEGSITQCSHCSCKVFGKAVKRKLAGKELNFCCEHCAEHFSHRHP